MKAKLAGAARGHNLLKKKADALTIRFRAILARIVEVQLLSLVLLFRRRKKTVTPFSCRTKSSWELLWKRLIGPKLLPRTLLATSRTKGSFVIWSCSLTLLWSPTVLQNVGKANYKLRVDTDNVAGVFLPIYKPIHEGGKGTGFLPTIYMWNSNT